MKNFKYFFLLFFLTLLLYPSCKHKSSKENRKNENNEQMEKPNIPDPPNPDNPNPPTPPVPDPDNPTPPNNEEKITITIKNNHAILTNESFEVKRNTKWKEIKNRSEIKSIKAEEGYEFIGLSLKETEFIQISDAESFTKNACIYVFTEKKVVEKISVLILGDAHIKFKNKEEDSVLVEKGSLWKDVKKKFESAIEYNAEKYVIEGWKLAYDRDSEDIDDELIFETNTSVCVFSKIIPGIEESELKNIKFNDMQEIYPPTEGIVGKATEDYFKDTSLKDAVKGVFINGRTVKLSPYKIAKFELTYEIWEIVYSWAVRHNYSFINRGRSNSTNQDAKKNELNPVSDISWNDAIVWLNAYTEFSNNGSDEECVYRVSSTDNRVIKHAKEVKNPYYDKTKKGYRLPTEAEWEYAARYQGKDNSINAELYGDIYLTKLDSMSGAKYPIGCPGLSASRLPNDMRDYKGNIKRLGWEELKNEILRVSHVTTWYSSKKKITTYCSSEGCIPVDQKKDANSLGVYNMSGNVSEYCFDLYSKIETETIDDPIGPEYSDENARVIRGGNFRDAGIFAGAVGLRLRVKEDEPQTNTAIGMRVAMSL